ncbi:multicopper oxidase [Tilletiaria anomala UBC 951]|uniref:Multicopper oxidase n=1 Tax=Tilletiaria anomala (strain ATCC 24038 / CBS 436.72 / UBC 951) TaxID=1037660 RepID=A0A066W0G1_TILAU|nr:multicopper oxidase [Tilletiaria anomala UBC 951]KDN44554.1 multicopper oxidase [Tilletiaria anomala UBC 951]
MMDRFYYLIALQLRGLVRNCVPPPIMRLAPRLGALSIIFSLLASGALSTKFFAQPRVPPVSRDDLDVWLVTREASAVKQPRDSDYASPIIGGLALEKGYLLSRGEVDRERNYASPIIGGITQEKGYIVRKRDDPVIYTDGNFPAPNKTFTITVSKGWYAPDGFGRIHYLINGQYPAETLVWDEDDWVQITVINNSSTPFAIHWHGIYQIGTPHMDGVPGVTQWNIPYGEQYVYRFQVKGQYGAFWAHSHTLGYYSDGLRMPIYVRPKSTRAKPWSLISNDIDTINQLEWAEGNYSVHFRTDQWHITADEMQLEVHTTGVPPACMDSLLINGRGRQYCHDNYTAVVQPVTNILLAQNSDVQTRFSSKGCLSLVAPKHGFDAITVLDEYFGGKCQNTTAPITVYNAGAALAAGRRYLSLQIIDAETNWYSSFSIDNHRMWLVAVDGLYVQPKIIEFAQLTIGARISVMIELDESKAYQDWPIRFTGLRALQPIEGFALLSYNSSVGDTVTPSIDDGFNYLHNRINSSVTYGGAISTSAIQWNQSADIPFEPSSAVPTYANVTLHAYISQGSLNVWQIAEQPMNTVQADERDPVLFQLTEEGKSLEDIDTSMMPLSPKIPDGSVVDIVIENPPYSIVGKSNAPHPFHLHHHHFWVIGQASGSFAYDTVEEAQNAGVKFNFENPPMRDSFDIGPNAWTTIRFVANAHGAAVMLHCHIDDHLMQGMATVILEGIDTVPRGTFSSKYTAQPSNFRLTENDPVQAVLEESWQTGSRSGIWPATVDPTNAWGDPRSAGHSLQSVASALSVSRAVALGLTTRAATSAAATATGRAANAAGAGSVVTGAESSVAATARGVLAALLSLLIASAAGPLLVLA